MKKNYKELFRNLETRVLHDLREAVEKSEYISEHLNEKAIKVSLFNFTELSIVNDRLTFLDEDGLHYSLYTDAYLKDLIDILQELPQ